MSIPTFPSEQSSIASIKTKNISKQFSSSRGELFVLENITLDVKAGEILAIIGRSGSGKTTLLNIISGLEKSTSGEIYTKGSVGYVPQRDLLLPWRTLLGNILLPVEIQKRNLKTSLIKARELLLKNGLAQFERSYPSEISGGMKQKVSLIRTLVQDSDIVLFDEPFSAIDFDARLQLAKEIRSYIVSAQKVAIFVTHNIEEAIAISDKLIVFTERPAKIIYQTNINIPDEYRDPVNVRKTKDFHELFERIWKLVSKQV
jgi:NitT/TauT family transport system ATP-binding protein